MKPNAPDLVSMVRAARRQYRPGTGTVYDKLLRQAGPSAAWLAEELRSTCGVETVNAEEVAPDFSVLNSATATAWRCVVLRSANDSVLRLGAEDPWDEALLHKASMVLGQALTPAAVTYADLCRWLGRDGGIPMRHESLVELDVAPMPGATSVAANSPRPGYGPTSTRSTSMSAVSIMDAIDGEACDVTVAKFADAAIGAALKNGTSSIHFECDRAGMTVKHRRDGVMTIHSRIDGAQQAEEVISRIKLLAQLDIAEKRLPQDGRLRYRAGDEPVELRVSIMPTVCGEDAVCVLQPRLPRECKDDFTLDSLGMASDHAQAIRTLAAQPAGLLLVTGPAGSGKTTTVCALLAQTHSGREKTVSIEDPVEYELAGVLQTSVNERRGLTFARGLRSLLRHDPDRIFIGDIRDAETAQIAVHSALAGHSVFATVHANGVTDIIGRMRHFGLDMFAVMSSLSGIVVQRLARRACPHCSVLRDATPGERDWLARAAQVQPMQLAQANGCGHCEGSGYQGRLVLTEVHAVDDALRDLVTQGASTTDLKRHIYREGVEPLAVQAARSLRAGHTTIEEIRRVVG